MPRPNVILCTCDQLRAFEVGCYGNRVVRTPNMDRLAREGTRFATAVTNYPVCMAARSVLLSGQYNRTCTGGVANVAYPSKPGDHNMPEYPERGRPHLPDTTLAEAMRTAGYHTTAIGKWHIHSWPDEVGFEDYVIPRVHHCHSGQSFTENGGPEFVPEEYSVDYEAARVESFIEARAARSDPFFLYYNISPPHCPVADAPERYLTMYPPETVPLRPNADPERTLDRQEHWFRVYRYDFRYYNLGLPYTERLPEGYDLRHLIAEYYGLTTWADDAFGRMLAALDRAGIADNTLVVLTADHGDNLGSHGLVQKGGPTEESVRVPMIVRPPARAAQQTGLVSDRVVSLVDVAPAIMALAGVQVPTHMPGRALMHALAPSGVAASGAGDVPPNGFAFIETAAGVAVRTARHMCFLRYATGSRELSDTAAMLYDMEGDPYQLRNLADDPAHVGEAAELCAAIRQWDRRTPWMVSKQGDR